MEPLLTKEEIEKISKIEGEVRGVAFKGDADFIIHETGKEGLLRLEQTMAVLGFPIKYTEMKPMNFYPLSLDAANLVVTKRLFHFDDKKIQEMGAYLSRVSIVLKLFMKYFVSLETLTERVPEIWDNYYTVGKISIAKMDKKNQIVNIRLEGFAPHELYCQLFQGYFCNVIQMVVGKKPISSEEKCIFKGDPYHEFVIKW